MAILIMNSQGKFGIRQGVDALQSGGCSLDALEAAIREVELDENAPNVGLGSPPNMEGVMELDAAVMDGVTLQTGAVGALQGFLHPVSIARRVMADSPHELLVGEGAARFAREIYAEAAKLLTPKMEDQYQHWIQSHLAAEIVRDIGNAPLAGLIPNDMYADDEIVPGRGSAREKDTVIGVARDQQGNIASSTSTSGWPLKYPGRLGDSPVIGAGQYAHNRFGAAACTHTGEMTIRTSAARSIILYMKMGMSLEKACREAASDLRELKGGTLGEVILYAIDAEENHCVLSYECQNTYFLWKSGMEQPDELNTVRY